MEKYKVLIVEDEKIAGLAILDHLKNRGYEGFLFHDAESAYSFFLEHPVDLILLDYKLPGMSGEELFEKIKRQHPMIPVIFMTAYSSVEKAVKLLKNGAFHYLVKPIEMDELLHSMNNALEKTALIKENRRLQADLTQKFSFENYIFNSDKMQQVMNLVLRSADSLANILLTGESGTGKEVIASIIHYYSSRKNNKFIKVNLSSLPETLIEAELFGAEKGSYTGSIQTRTGKFEEADNGTLFLDEIGELPPEIQVKLLRTIQERELTRLGSNEPIRIDIRLITATNQDLQILVKEKKFREDLFYRLNVINIDLPPLRERKEDIPMLVDLFIRKFNQRENKSITTISKDALNRLIRYSYPGNIRELENIIERAVILCRDEVITAPDLPLFLSTQEAQDLEGIMADNALNLSQQLSLVEKKIIVKTLDQCKGNQSRAAKKLGISESGLRYKLKSLDLDKTESPL